MGTGLDIFTNKKYEMIESSTHNVEVPNVSKHEYQLIDISDEGFMSLMDDDGTMKEDLKVPDGEVGEQIREKLTTETSSSSPLRAQWATSKPCPLRSARNKFIILLKSTERQPLFGLNRQIFAS